MRTLLAAVLGVSCLVVTTAQDKFEADKLNGTWKVSGGKKGTADPNEEAKKTVVTFTKEKMTMKMNLGGMDATFEFKYTIDSKATPVTIDLEITDGPIGKGEKRKGILELKGDDLKLSYPSEDGDRPTKFDDGKSFSWTMKREKAEKKDAKKEEKKEVKK